MVAIALKKTCLSVMMLISLAVTSQAQGKQSLSFFQPADSINQKRLLISSGVGLSLYAGSLIVLDRIWYSEHPRTHFHFFNDWNEWGHMDKLGHFYASYVETLLLYKLARWTGIDPKASQWLAFGVSNLYQASIEVMDGFSEKWGFSIPDIAFNLAGSGLFVTQQQIWNEQRIHIKFSSSFRQYSLEPIQSPSSELSTDFKIRAYNLFGHGFFERTLKDYNAQTIWASVNIHSFLPSESGFPKWLNVSVGYGAENMFAGFGYSWSEEGTLYVVDKATHPRYRQFYLSPDVDFSKVPTKSHLLKTIFTFLNLVKVPAPAVEITTEGKFRFHLILF